MQPFSFTEATIPEIEYAIKTVVYLLIMGYRDDGGLLFSGDLTRQVHDDAGTF